MSTKGDYKIEFEYINVQRKKQYMSVIKHDKIQKISLFKKLLNKLYAKKQNKLPKLLTFPFKYITIMSNFINIFYTTILKNNYIAKINKNKNKLYIIN